MKIYIVIFSLLLVAAIVQASRHSSRKIRGCGSRLVDTLREACGERGLRSMQMLYLMQKYKRLRNKRSLSGVEVEEIFSMLVSTKTSANKATSFPENTGLESIFQIVTLRKNLKNGQRRRLRRSVVRDCCYRDCDTEKVRRKYCQGFGGW